MRDMEMERITSHQKKEKHDANKNITFSIMLNSNIEVYMESWIHKQVLAF